MYFHGGCPMNIPNPTDRMSCLELKFIYLITNTIKYLFLFISFIISFLPNID